MRDRFMRIALAGALVVAPVTATACDREDRKDVEEVGEDLEKGAKKAGKEVEQGVDQADKDGKDD